MISLFIFDNKVYFKDTTQFALKSTTLIEFSPETEVRRFSHSWTLQNSWNRVVVLLKSTNLPISSPSLFDSASEWSWSSSKSSLDFSLQLKLFERNSFSSSESNTSMTSSFWLKFPAKTTSFSSSAEFSELDDSIFSWTIHFLTL